MMSAIGSAFGAETWEEIADQNRAYTVYIMIKITNWCSYVAVYPQFHFKIAQMPRSFEIVAILLQIDGSM
jgi:hypothetical protein